MLDSRDRLTTSRPAAPPEVQPDAGAPFGRPGDRIPGILALGVGVSWIVMLQGVMSLAPPADPSPPVWSILIGDLLLLSLLAGAVGLGMRRRWGLLASLGGGAVLLVGAVGCQLIGHTGLALAAQYLAGGALMAFSVGGLRAT